MHTNHMSDRNQTALADGEYVAEWPITASEPEAFTLVSPSTRPSPNRRALSKADGRNETRLQRLLKLIEIMRSDRAFGADELAKKTGVSRRTIFRDLEMLTRVGVPVQFDDHCRGYQINQWYFLPPTSLNLFEVTSLYVAAKKMAGSRTYPLSAEAAHAIEKMAQTLAPGLWDACSQMARLVEVRWPAMVDTSPTRWIFQTLLKAAAEHCKVALEYDIHSSDRKARIILRPYLLTLLDRTWYVIGYCEERQKVQTLPLDLILSADCLMETFEAPSNFSLDSYLGQAWMLSPEGSISSVRLRFSPKVADRVEDAIWHKTQRTQRLQDGSLIFEADVDGLTEISYWILGYGDEVVVEKPVELRTRIQQIANSILKQYANQQDGPDHPSAR